MKKQISKILMVLAIASAGLIVIGNNVLASGPTNPSLPPGDGIGEGTLYGTSSGTTYCCCPGTNDCGAAACSGCPTN